MTIEQKLITVDEYEDFLVQHPDGLYELIHGEIVEKVTTQEHSHIAGIIVGELYIYLKQHPEVKAYMGPEARYKPADDQYNDRLPDVSVHVTDQPIVKRGAVKELPNLAVEIKSPTNTLKLMREKAVFYIENGCQMVWVVYPAKRLVEVYQPDNDIDILLESDTLNGGDVLPGFTLPVATIFTV